MAELTMMDVARMLNANVTGDLSDQEMTDILEYERLVDRVATDVFKTKSRDYVVYLSSLIQSIALQDMLDEGMDAEIIFALAKNPGLTMLMAHVIKATVGIGILEDFGGRFIPTPQDYIENMEFSDWMQNGKGVPPSSAKLEERRIKKVKSMTD